MPHCLRSHFPKRDKQQKPSPESKRPVPQFLMRQSGVGSGQEGEPSGPLLRVGQRCALDLALDR